MGAFSPDKQQQGGVVVAVVQNSLFRVELDDGRRVVAHLASSLRKVNIRLLVGERVEVVVSAFDASRGKIVGVG